MTDPRDATKSLILNPGDAKPPKYLALLFSDGSMSIFPPGWAFDEICEAREDADSHESDPREWAKIVRVTISETEVVFDPAEWPRDLSERWCAECGGRHR